VVAFFEHGNNFTGCLQCWGFLNYLNKVLSFQERLFLGAGNLENVRYTMMYVLH